MLAITRFLDALHSSRWDVATEVAVEMGGDILRLVDNRGWNALHYAVWNDCPASLAVVLVSQLGIPINSRDRRGNTCMHDAAFQNVNLVLVAALIDLGGDCNLANFQGETAVFEASYRSSAGLLEILLTKGRGDANVFTLAYRTPLISAVRERSNLYVIAKLLQFHADLDQVDFTQTTALEWAKRATYPAAVWLLERVRVMMVLVSPYSVTRWSRNRCMLPIELLRQVNMYI
ncbi:hypothetical protein BASA81_003067 [Batrachochytrium salamandrivorans]|nr:hypothetical protein BASA81_003067 [Batrachochytrium salamandrivorans]